MADKDDLREQLVDKWSVKPSLAGKLADILSYAADRNEIRTEMVVRDFGLANTTAKHYLRRLAEFGYLEAHGGNKNSIIQVWVRYLSPDPTALEFYGKKKKKVFSRRKGHSKRWDRLMVHLDKQFPCRNFAPPVMAIALDYGLVSHSFVAKHPVF